MNWFLVWSLVSGAAFLGLVSVVVRQVLDLRSGRQTFVDAWPGPKIGRLLDWSVSTTSRQLNKMARRLVWSGLLLTQGVVRGIRFLLGRLEDRLRRLVGRVAGGPPGKSPS